MALKYSFLLLAALLLVTAKAATDESVTEGHGKGKGYPPAQPPHPPPHDHDHHPLSPKKAPVYPPKVPIPPPKKAPIPYPKKAPTPQPPHSTVHTIAPPPHPHPHPLPTTTPASSNPCVRDCEAHCVGARKRRPCMKACTACCDKLHCVPSPYKKCDNWTFVIDRHNEKIKCP